MSTPDYSQWFTITPAAYREWLPDRSWHTMQAGSVGQYDDAEIRRYIENLADREMMLCREMLKRYTDIKNMPSGGLGTQAKLFVDDPVIDGIKQPGRWRLVHVGIELQQGKRVLVEVLRKGWATKVMWDEARKTRVKISHAGTTHPSHSLPPTADSNIPNRAFRLLLPNLAIDSVEAIVSSLSASTLANPTIEGEKLTGTWAVRWAESGRDEYGNAVIEVVISAEQFTLEAFRDYSFADWAKTVTIYRIPKADAQPIIELFRTAGNTVSPQFSDDGEFVTLQISMEQAVQQDRKWAYAQDYDTDAQEEQHNAMTWAEFTSLLVGTFSRESHAIDLTANVMDRDHQLRVELRPDGKINAFVRVLTAGQADDDLPKSVGEAGFATGMVIGESMEVLKRMWVQPAKTRDEVLQILAALSIQAQETGKNKKVLIQRREKGGYNLTIEIDEYNAVQSGALTIARSGVTGLAQQHYSGRSASALPVSTVGNYDDIDVEATVTPMGQINYRLVKRTVVPRSGTMGDAAATKFYWGGNEVDLPTIDTASTIIETSAVSVDPSGRLSWGIRTKAKNTGEMRTYTAAGKRAMIGSNVPKANLPASWMVGYDIDMSQFSVDDNGQVNYLLIGTSTDPLTKALVARTKGRTITATQAINDTVLADRGSPTERGMQRRIDIAGVTPDGRVVWSETAMQANPVTLPEILAEDDGIRKVFQSGGRNHITLPAAPAVNESIKLDLTDEDTYHWMKTRLVLNGGTDSVEESIAGSEERIEFVRDYLEWPAYRAYWDRIVTWLVETFLYAYKLTRTVSVTTSVTYSLAKPTATATAPGGSDALQNVRVEQYKEIWRKVTRTQTFGSWTYQGLVLQPTSMLYKVTGL